MELAILNAFTAPQPPHRPTTLHWVASLTATAIYAAEAVSRGLPVVDSPLDHGFLDGVRELRSWIGRRKEPAALIWNHLGGLAGRLDDPYALASEVTVQLQEEVPAGVSAELGETIATLKQATRNACPDLLSELAVRVRPLREQWEARGPGLMRHASELVGISLSPDTIRVELVMPLLGGGGRAYLGYGCCCLEAVLVDRDGDLPEPVRLAWLIAQLALDQVDLHGSVSPGRYPLVCQLALIPPILEAAGAVEWLNFEPELIRRALAAWHVPTLPDRPAHEWLVHWWQRVRHEQLAWPDALTSLDEWLG